MKKSLIALAAFAATSAFAQSSVTLYGIVEATADIGYNSTKDSTTTVNTFDAAGTRLSSATTSTTSAQKNNLRIQDGNDQGTGTSRIGFRGTEDLGGGMKANFLMEMGLRIDDGAAPGVTGVNSGNSGGSLFGRNAWGGLSGGFGEVRVGRQVLGSFGVQANSWAAGASNGLYDAGMSTAPLMGGVRFSNAIRYLSPNFGGFKASVMLSAPETDAPTSTTSTSSTGAVTSTNTSRRTGVDLALEYANGPAYIGFGYNKRDTANFGTSSKPVAGGTLTGSNAGNLAFVSTLGTLPATVTGYTIGGSYDLGVVKPFINYTRQNSNLNGSETFTAAIPANSTSETISGNLNTRAVSIGLRAPVGAFTVIAGYGRSTTTGNFAANFTGGGVTDTGTVRVDEKRDAFQLGAQYALSKRTLVEANYGYNKSRGNASGVATSTVVGSGRDEFLFNENIRVTAINVGLKHSF